MCDGAASGLAELGIAAGDRVSMYSANRWEWVVAYFALLGLGAVVSPLNAVLSAVEVAYAVEDCGSRAILTSADKLAVVAGVAAGSKSVEFVVSFDENPPGDARGVVGFDSLLREHESARVAGSTDPLAVIFFTSGSTGRPKGAMQSHRGLVLNASALACAQARTERDVLLSAMPNSTFTEISC